jgi:acyl transferase domain-containing protein
VIFLLRARCLSPSPSKTVLLSLLSLSLTYFLGLFREGYVTAERQIFSPSGHCRPFDHRADGTVPADAVCALVLRRLDDAISDGDQIYSVISGIAIGSDGSTEKAGCTVPSPRGQAETIKRAWKDANIPATKLVYAE